MAIDEKFIEEDEDDDFHLPFDDVDDNDDFGEALKAARKDIRSIQERAIKGVILHEEVHNKERWFKNIHSERDIIELADRIIDHANQKTQSGCDSHVYATLESLYSAIIGYIYYVAPIYEQNTDTLRCFALAVETKDKDDDEDFKDALDLVFEEATEIYGENWFPLLMYNQYKSLVGGKRERFLLSNLFIWLNDETTNTEE